MVFAPQPCQRDTPETADLVAPVPAYRTPPPASHADAVETRDSTLRPDLSPPTVLPVSVREGEYGPVVAVDGPHEGKHGYYDDDTWECDPTAHGPLEDDEECPPGPCRSFAIVYFGEPLVGPYHVVPHEHLVPDVN